ncbi:MAG TPA: DUF5317 family protein [Acidimicrobiales bacterium]
MVLTLTAVALGLALGLALPAQRTRFARPRIHKPALLVAGAVGQVIAARMDSSGAFVVMLASLGVLVWFAIANLHLVGMGVVAIGLCSNIIPIALNQGMPVRAEALVHAHVVDAGDINSVELTAGRHLEQPDDLMVAFADIVPLAAGRAVISFGDLIIFVGTIDVIVHLVRRQRPRLGARRSGRGAHFHAPLDLRDRTIARHVQDWGRAPRPVPSSGSQNSENSERSEPRTVASATGAPARHNK